MITGSRRLALVLLLACSTAPAIVAAADDAAMRRAEQRQMMEESGSKAQYNRSVKEANAAYADAARECGRMGARQKSRCMVEARTNLRNDLAAARGKSGDAAGMRR